MIKIEGFEMWGCPFAIVFSTNDLKTAEEIFNTRYPNSDKDLFKKVVDKFGHTKNSSMFEVDQS